VRPPAPLEACIQIAGEHAAGTIAAIAKERAARLAVGLQEYANTLIELADEKAKPKLSAKTRPTETSTADRELAHPPPGGDATGRRGRTGANHANNAAVDAPSTT
jgi:hypothetical protein